MESKEYAQKVADKISEGFVEETFAPTKKDKEPKGVIQENPKNIKKIQSLLSELDKYLPEGKARQLFNVFKKAYDLLDPEKFVWKN